MNVFYLKNLWNKCFGCLVSPGFCYALILMGILIRMKVFAENHSLWLDETLVAVNLTSRSWQDILNHTTSASLQYWPNRPVGFSLLVKGIVSLFGPQEWAFRLLPLCSGILSVFLFYHMAKRCLSQGALPLALAFFVFGEHVIYYANELKPYATDLLMTLVLYTSYFSVQFRQVSLRDAIKLGIMGWLALWISYTSLFVIVSLACGFLFRWLLSFLRKSGSQTRREQVHILVLLLIWGWSIGQVYVLAMVPAATNVELQGQWATAFMPRPVWSIEALHWVWQSWRNYIINPLGLAIPGVIWIFIGWGTYQIFPKSGISQQEASAAKTGGIQTIFLLWLPLILVFGAAIFEKYPFEGRVLLFTVPAALILTAGGIDALFCLPRGRWLARGLGVMSIALIGMSPIRSSWNLINESQDFEESRPIMQAFAKDYQPGDAIFLNRYAEWPFYIYGYSLGFNQQLTKEDAGWWQGKQRQGVKVGRIYDNLGKEQGVDVAGWRYVYYVYNEEGKIVEALMNEHSDVHLLSEKYLFLSANHHRIWVILIHYSPEIYDFVLSQMDLRGRRIKTLVLRGASLFLYDFSPPQEDCEC
jgi:hypothetical protein